MATRTLNKDGVCCLGNHGARRGEGNLNTYPAPLKLKASTNKLAKTSKSSDGVLTAFRHFHPLDPLSVSGTKHLLSYRCLPPSRSLLLPTLSFKRRIFLSPSSACSRRRPSSHSCHAPSKGYMAHFLISGIVGHLGSQACLLESYLCPLLLPLLTAQRTTSVDLVFVLFEGFFAFFPCCF